VDVYLGRREYWDAFAGLLSGLGLTQEQAAAVSAAAGQRAATVEKRTLFDGVAETLAALKRTGVRLAVLSDTESREPRVRRRLADLDIERHFDAVLTSIDLGCVKPDRRAYAAALAALDASPGEALFVGHDDDELVGAAEAGIDSAAYNAGDDAPATYHLSHFADLVGIALGRRSPGQVDGGARS
jgi:putative hydrolase of the HAD superfamily